MKNAYNASFTSDPILVTIGAIEADHIYGNPRRSEHDYTTGDAAQTS